MHYTSGVTTRAVIWLDCSKWLGFISRRTEFSSQPPDTVKQISSITRGSSGQTNCDFCKKNLHVMCVSRFQQSSSAARVEVGGWICGRWFPRKCCMTIKESCLGLKFSYERKIMDEWIKFWHRVLQGVCLGVHPTVRTKVYHDFL